MKEKKLNVIDTDTGGKGSLTLGGQGRYGSKIQFSKEGAVTESYKRMKNG